MTRDRGKNGINFCTCCNYGKRILKNYLLLDSQSGILFVGSLKKDIYVYCEISISIKNGILKNPLQNTLLQARGVNPPKNKKSQFRFFLIFYKRNLFNSLLFTHSFKKNK